MVAAAGPPGGVACCAAAATSSATPSTAWTGEGETVDEFVVGEIVYHLNPYFSDGTRLRSGPDKEAGFNGEHVLNDAEVEVIALEAASGGFARVREYDESGGVVADGWLRQRNLTHVKRGQGLRGCRDRSGAPVPSRPGRGNFSLARGATISDLRPADGAQAGEPPSL